jgi:hypothetical protein
MKCLTFQFPLISRPCGWYSCQWVEIHETGVWSKTLFIDNFYNEFHENPPKALVANIRSYTNRQTDGKTQSPHFLYEV